MAPKTEGAQHMSRVYDVKHARHHVIWRKSSILEELATETVTHIASWVSPTSLVNITTIFIIIEGGKPLPTNIEEAKNTCCEVA